MSSAQQPRRAADTEGGTDALLPGQQQLAGGNHPARQEQARHGAGGESFSWLTVIGLLFLTFNSGMAILRSRGDLWAIAFVVFSYTDLMLLFGCLRLYEHTDPDSPRRDQLKVAVWLLTTTLTAAFSYKVAAIMPLPVAMLVWAMAFGTVAGGYYAFFLHSEK